MDDVQTKVWVVLSSHRGRRENDKPSISLDIVGEEALTVSNTLPSKRSKYEIKKNTV